MSLFRKTVGVRCVGQIDPKCENFVNNVLMGPHRTLCDRCGDTVERVTAPNRRLTLGLIAVFVLTLAVGSALVYQSSTVTSSSDLDSTPPTGAEVQPDPNAPPIESRSAQPSDEDLRSRMGEAARLAGARDFEGALRLYREVEKHKSEFPQLKSQLGGIHLKQGRYEDARRYIEEAIAADPNDMVAHYNLACLFVKDNKNDQAVEELGKAIAAGFHQADDMENDPDLAKLKSSAAFKQLVKDLRMKQTLGR
jgi:tetratricopeptide (TPR) repeat protein